MKSAVVVAIFVATVVLALARPRHIHEGVWTTCGALGMWAVGAVEARGFRDLYYASRTAIWFLVALLILSTLVDKSGVFEWAALLAARRARGSGRALFRNVFLLGTIVTAALSLDTTAVLLTPVVLAFVRRLGVPARPYVIACAFVANAASLLLPISNLTNLILTAAFHISFAAFVTHMLPVQLVVLGVTYASLAHHFRSELAAFDAARADGDPADVVPNRFYFRVTLAVLGLALVGYLAAPIVGIEPYVVAFVASGILAIVGARERRVERSVVFDVSWGVIPFVLGLFVVVQGLDSLGLASAAAGFLTNIPAGRVLRTLATTGASALGLNVANNLPATLVARSALQRIARPGALVYATLIGTNVGPNVVPFGSLASILVLTIARERGVRVSGWAFARAGISTTPVACVLAAIVLAATTR